MYGGGGVCWSGTVRQGLGEDEVVLTVREDEDLNVAWLLRAGMVRVISVYAARASALYCTTTTIPPS